MNKCRRLDFTKEWIFWNKDNWNKVIFFYEFKLKVFCSDGRIRVLRKPGETYLEKNLNKIVQYNGDYLTVWGCMSNSGIENLVF